MNEGNYSVSEDGIEKSNGLKLRQGKFRLDMKNKLGIIAGRERCPAKGGCGAPSLYLIIN